MKRENMKIDPEDKRNIKITYVNEDGIKKI